MKKVIFFTLISLFSVSAFADDFTCTMNVGSFNRAKETAPYRGRAVTVKLGTFICTATIDNNIIVTTSLKSTETDESSSRSSRGFSETELTALNQWGDGQDHAVCKCGLE